MAVLCLVTMMSARARAGMAGDGLEKPVALSLSTAATPMPSGADGFAAPSSLLATGDLGYETLSGVAATPARTWEALPAGGFQTSLVPLPEPSSGAALYFLSGVVGLALVVMRRRTLA